MSTKLDYNRYVGIFIFKGQLFMGARLDKGKFIEKSKSLYGDDAFDYSEVEYINGYTDIVLTCKKHGKIKITPNKHFDIVGGCPLCSKEKRKKPALMSNDDYKSLVVKLHGGKYDLSKVEYKGMKKHVTATCPLHGDFSITAYDFAYKRGCGKCGIDKRAKHSKREKTGKKTNKTKLTTNVFINKAKEIFGDYYDYSATDLSQKDEKGRIRIICPKHGEFWQNPYSHLHGHGCSKCGREQMAKTQTMTTEQFIEKANIVHNFKYDYSETIYNGCSNDVEIICPKHGKFKQAAYVHLAGHGCKKCADEFNSSNLLSNTDEFIEKAKSIHGNDNDYSLVEYHGAKEPVTIICKNGHKYMQMPNKHLSGHACPFCTNNVSRKETELAEYIKSLGLEIKISQRTVLGDSKELDILIPSKNLAIEFDGLYWHSEVKKTDKRYHLDKTIECEKKGIRLIHVFEDEWDFKKEIVKSRIKNILTLNDKRIYARNCEIRPVDSEICRQFLDNNHMQGGINASIKYGLYYENELVSVMTFCKLRKNLGHKPKNGEYELLRFCNKLNTAVIGGASKLFKHFIDEYKPDTVISYSDRRWNTGNVYKKMGFKFSHYSQPNYFYIIGQNRYNRFGFRKDILVKNGFDPNKSEHQIMFERGIYRIYDCGTAVYKWFNKD